MTTETSRTLPVLVATAGATLVLGLLLSAVAALAADRAAGLGALVGTVLAVAVLFGGALLVDLVATVMPMASMMVALLTYTLQLLVLLLAFLALERSGVLVDGLDRGWLGGAVIGVTMAWLAVQLRLFVRRRVAVFDLPHPTPHHHGEGGH